MFIDHFSVERMACCDEAKISKGHWDMCVSDQDALDSFFNNLDDLQDLPDLVIDQDEEPSPPTESVKLRIPYKKNEQAIKDLNLGYADGMVVLPIGWTIRSVNNTIEFKNRNGNVCGEYNIVTRSLTVGYVCVATNDKCVTTNDKCVLRKTCKSTHTC